MSHTNPNSPPGFPPLGPPDRPRAIVVADDDWVVADSLALILKQRGYQARPVYSGEEAVRAAAEIRPDYLISDVFMYKVSGIEAARLICEQFPGCKVILFSGHAEAEDLIGESCQAGAAPEFLQKPFHPDVLLRRLQANM